MKIPFFCRQICENTNCMKQFFLFLMIFWGSFSCVLAQEEKNLEFKQLEDEIYLAGNKQEKQYDLIKKYIVLAKKQNNNDELFGGYFFAADKSPVLLRSHYADSLVTLAIKIGDRRYIGLAYQSSADANLDIYNYEKSLEHALISYDYLKNDNSKEYSNSSKVTIGHIRYLLGDLKKAHQILTETTSYFKWKQEKMPSKKGDYLFSLYFLTKVNSAIGNFEENSAIFDEINKETKNNKKLAYYSAYFSRAFAFNLYKKNDYKRSIQKYLQSLEEFHDEDKHLEEKFYIGMSFWKLNQPEQALSYFEEINKDYTETGRISMEFRPMFEFYIDYYKNKGNREKQLQAVENLLAYDRKFAEEQKNLVYKLNTDYDEKRLLEEKAKIESDRKKERWAFIASIVFTVLGIISYIFYRIKRKQELREMAMEREVEYEEKDEMETDVALENAEESPILSVHESDSVNDLDENTAPEFDENEQKITNEEDDDIAYILHPTEKPEPELEENPYYPISPETLKHILKKLENFEQKNKFLKKNIRLIPLAEEFSTNEKYLAKVIKVNTGLVFNHYINDLRFKYLAKKVDEEPSFFKKKKIRDISSHLGFSTPEAFTNLFTERYGIPPTEYLEGLMK